MKRILITLNLILISSALIGQSGITGNAEVRVLNGGTLCGGAAAVVDVYVDVTGLTGFETQPAGLNAFQVEFTVDGFAQAWFANSLAANNEQVVFSVVASDKSHVTATGTLTIVGWTAGDTPNTDYLVGKLIFSGSPTAGSGQITPMTTGALASKWWDDGTPDGDGPGPIPFTTLGTLSVLVPDWPGLTLSEGCSFWMEVDSQYDFSSPGNTVDMLDLVELVNCGAPTL